MRSLLYVVRTRICLAALLGKAGQYQAEALDLKDWSVARGESGHTPKTEPLILPSKPFDLAIYPAIGSEPGVYQVQPGSVIEENR